jgi:hypothetical protein
MEVFVSSTYWYKCSTLYRTGPRLVLNDPEMRADGLPDSPEMEDGHRLTQ